jgi:hypothetical protein
MKTLSATFAFSISSPLNSGGGSPVREYLMPAEAKSMVRSVSLPNNLRFILRPAFECCRQLIAELG